jgi:ribosome-associated protein
MPDTTKPTDKAVAIRAEPIDLCQLLKFSGLTESGGAAKQAVADGLVRLNGAVETQKRKKVMAGDRVTFDGQTLLVRLGA